jgi:hypothetical protein
LREYGVWCLACCCTRAPAHCCCTSEHACVHTRTPHLLQTHVALWQELPSVLVDVSTRTSHMLRGAVPDDTARRSHALQQAVAPASSSQWYRNKHDGKRHVPFFIGNDAMIQLRALTANPGSQLASLKPNTLLHKP